MNVRLFLFIWLLGVFSWAAELAAAGNWVGFFGRITNQVVIFLVAYALAKSWWRVRDLFRRPRRADALTRAWGVISNVDGGDWAKQDPKWREAAEEWREDFFS